MADDERELKAGERWVTQVDPHTGRITNVVEENWLL
jgi:hypothetical protein